MAMLRENTSNLYDKVIRLLNDARSQIIRNVNKTIVYTYCEIGRMIVEDEQEGKDRAEYGKSVLKELSERLTNEFGKGFSVDNLENMRKFYIVYSNSLSIVEKSETLSRISEIPDFKLSWSHYP
jgi:hypothetical protein